MVNRGEHPILGINITACDYEFAVDEIVKHAKDGEPFSVSALAVHGVMTGAEEEHRRRLNGLDMVVPDGQPVRWALKWLHNIALDDRVYGPELTIRLIAECARQGVPIYLYGSTEETVGKLMQNLNRDYDGLRIAGWEPSKFKRLNPEEKKDVVQRIKDSGAQVVFVGLGCPRQEVWAFEYRNELRMPILAVGAAFDFHAGTLPQAPSWMQDKGLEWLFRLIQEPKRLWRRYLFLNPAYLWGVFREKVGLRKLAIVEPTGKETIESYG